MIELMTAAAGKGPGPVVPKPISGYNFSGGSTSVLPTVVSPMTVAADTTLPPYNQVLAQNVIGRLSTMAEIIKIATGDFTFEHWIKMVGGTNGYGFNLRGNNSDAVLITAYDSNSGPYWRVYGLGYPNGFQVSISMGGVNAWSHLAIVRKSGRLYAYVNGVPAKLNSGSGAVDSLPSTTSMGLIISSSSGIHSSFYDFRWAEFAVSDFAKYEGAFTPGKPLY